MNLKPYYLFVLLCHSLLIGQHVNASESVPISTWQYLDTENQLTLDDITTLSESNWRPLSDQITGYLFTETDYWASPQDSVLWIKVDVPTASRLDRIWLELLPNVGIDGKIAIFDGSRWQWQDPVNRGTEGSFMQPARYLTFILDTSNENKIAYLKLTTEQTFQFSIKATSVDGLLWYLLSTHLFFGLVMGMLALAMFYNFAIGVRAREPVYLSYAFYVFCNLIYLLVMAGYFRLMFPSWGGKALLSNSATMLAVLSAYVFVRQFLDTKESLPRFDIVVRLMMAVLTLWLMVIPFVPDLYAYSITIFLGVASPMVALVVAYLSLRQGHPMAIYFLIAWSSFLVSAGLWGWMWLGMVEPKEWVVVSYYLGTLFEVILLSMVLGFKFSSLKQQTESLGKEKKRYKQLSFTDELTGVYNRRGFVKEVEREIETKRDSSLIWLALDVDHFKNFNDQYGHPAGDDLLKQMGELLNSMGRQEDIAGRIGGEEFALLLVNCSIDNAEKFMDRLLDKFSDLKVVSPKGKEVGTTLSIGATEVKLDDTLDYVWQRADKLLYQAKEQGRNQAVVG